MANEPEMKENGQHLGLKSVRREIGEWVGDK